MFRSASVLPTIRHKMSRWVQLASIKMMSEDWLHQIDQVQNMAIVVPARTVGLKRNGKV
jgi:hypothetical protein